MLSGNYNYQYMDWSHSKIQGEDFKHEGNLVTNLITPTITIGLSDYLNISYQQALGVRAMDWGRAEESGHHRSEDSLSDFLDQAEGSLFGDARINLKYLLTNTGLQPGSRIFLGMGLTIPSNSVLKESPFIEVVYDEDGIPVENSHRHFSLSDGAYKANLELQYYIKNSSKSIFIPAFYGLTANYIKPLNESKYGYKPSTTYIGVGSCLFSTQLKNIWAPKGISLGLAFLKTEEAYWDELPAPNSKTEVFIPSLGMIWSHKDYGSLSVNLKYNKNEVIPEAGDGIENESTSFEISVGYRKTLNYTIPWLYY